jgi:mono/diheme cytochrome c family protein
MTRFLVLVLLAATVVTGTESTTPSTTPDQPQAVTFNKDVLPILQKNCQTCHRTGGIAPMALVTYDNVKPWAKAIKAAVLNKQMPPWFADPSVGSFRNAPEMTAADAKVLAAWADNGAREGNAADKPKDIAWIEGWRTQPDVIIEMPTPYRVAAKGEGEVRQFMIQNPFKEDTWVTSIEIRPGNPSVVHHAMLQIPEGGGLGASKIVFREALPNGVAAAPQIAAIAGQSLEPQAFSKKLETTAVMKGQLENTLFALGQIAGARGGNGGSYSDLMSRLREQQTGEGAFTAMEAIYAPGSQPLDFRYTGSAKLVKGGVPMRLEVHYTPNGAETTDKTTVGFTLAKAPAQRRFVIMAPEHLVDDRIPIAAGHENWETRGELTFKQDADLVWFMPHMHLRGKDMTFQLVHPDGKEETVLRAGFDFHWQLGYEVAKPIKVTKGTRMIVTAHHDNSANNALNPTPGKEATWGEMTSQEMMLPWFGVVVDGDATPEAIATYRPPNLEGPFPSSGGGAVRVKAQNLLFQTK